LMNATSASCLVSVMSVLDGSPLARLFCAGFDLITQRYKLCDVS
jgi:hypothetical protein